MSAYADRQWRLGKVVRPTEFLPNGCGPKAGRLTSILVPDEIAGVGYSDCCDLHDLAYYQGGFLGLFWRKPKADIALAVCMFGHFRDAASLRWDRETLSGRVRGAATYALGAVASPLFALAVTVFGWTPFTWRWRGKTATARALHRMKRALSANGL